MINTIFWSVLAIAFLAMCLYFASANGRDRAKAVLLLIFLILALITRGCIGCFSSPEKYEPMEIRLFCTTYNKTKNLCEEITPRIHINNNLEQLQIEE